MPAISMILIENPLRNVHFVFQTASLLAALAHPSHRVYKQTVIYAPGDVLPCRRDAI
ncbi:hypothetical protein [Xenorhabdus santafensis]|uniref:hypothetical protein n=1 Tax=Xenorhabdus santafensis TaxID=2582833 RepID=UPI0029E81CB0|nr:hypothetical protein [Xenorhabdus sp. 12]